MGILDEDVARVRDVDRPRRPRRRAPRAEARRRAVRRPVPVPPGEDAVVLREPRAGRLLLLRLPGVAATRSRSCARWSTSTSSTRSSGSPRVRASRSATTTSARTRTGRARRASPRRSARRSTTTTGCCSSRPRRAAARKYLRSRGFDGDAVRRFKLGWAPDEWDHLSRTCRRRATSATTSSRRGSRS